MWAANLSRVLRELLGVSGIGWGGVEAGARGSQKPLQSRGVGCWDPELLSAAVLRDIQGPGLVPPLSLCSLGFRPTCAELE